MARRTPRRGCGTAGGCGLASGATGPPRMVALRSSSTRWRTAEGGPEGSVERRRGAKSRPPPKLETYPQVGCAPLNANTCNPTSAGCAETCWEIAQCSGGGISLATDNLAWAMFDGELPQQFSPVRFKNFSFIVVDKIVRTELSPVLQKT